MRAVATSVPSTWLADGWVVPARSVISTHGLLWKGESGEWHRDLGLLHHRVRSRWREHTQPRPFLWICVKDRQKEIFPEAAQIARWVRPAVSTHYI